jgi:ssDNA-specific exonuclease RecJ
MLAFLNSSKSEASSGLAMDLQFIGVELCEKYEIPVKLLQCMYNVFVALYFTK